jgi:hypothetical protein
MNTNNMAIFFFQFGLDSGYGKSLKELDINTFNCSYSFLAMHSQQPKKKNAGQHQQQVAFFLLAICSQKTVLEITSARIMYFLRFSIAIIIPPKSKNNWQISIQGSSTIARNI